MAADAVLRNEDNTSVFLAPQTPLLMNDAEVALGITVITGNHGALLGFRRMQDSLIILLHVQRQSPGFEDVVSLGMECIRQFCWDHNITEQPDEERLVTRRFLAHGVIGSCLGALAA